METARDLPSRLGRRRRAQRSLVAPRRAALHRDGNHDVRPAEIHLELTGACYRLGQCRT